MPEGTKGTAITKPKNVAVIVGPSGNLKLEGPWKVCLSSYSQPIIKTKNSQESVVMIMS